MKNQIPNEEQTVILINSGCVVVFGGWFYKWKMCYYYTTIIVHVTYSWLVEYIPHHRDDCVSMRIDIIFICIMCTLLSRSLSLCESVVNYYILWIYGIFNNNIFGSFTTETSTLCITKWLSFNLLSTKNAYFLWDGENDNIIYRPVSVSLFVCKLKTKAAKFSEFCICTYNYYHTL